MEIKHLLEQLRKVHSEELALEIFILLLMVNGTESRRKNLMSWEILIRSVISQIIMVLVVINMVLNVEHHYDFGKINVGLIL